MASRFQACSLVGSPFYPNAIAWSEENLIAVASGHLVTILNPALPYGPRGLIKIPNIKPFPIGVIERKDLLSRGLWPTCFSRDKDRPCVRSLSWSPLGLSSNAGCLLAVCTADGRVELYRQPFFEFRAEWVEVMDISEMLYDYLAKVSFGESASTSSRFSDGLATDICTEHSCAEDLPSSVIKKGRKRGRDTKASGVGKLLLLRDSEDTSENNMPKSKAKAQKMLPESHSLPLISADQYASRIAKLSSLAVAWSPVLQLSSQNGSTAQNNSSGCCSLLAVGGKSGEVSFWRICGPQCFSVEHGTVPTDAALAGLIQAHNAWVTAISWALLAVDGLYPQVLLVTGCSDGSVKIWMGNGEELMKSPEVDHAPFLLLKEVVAIDSTPVSVLSVTVPVQSSYKMLLAVGKGSGSLEVWMCDMSTRKFDKVGSYDAHYQIVTGLAWAFDGSCLYSCSQDNSVRSWILCGTTLYEVPIPSNTLGVNSSSNLPNVSESCFGVAVSSGNLVLAVARSLDVDSLDQMYQARTLKAVVEFFWIGGQQLDTSSKNTFLESDVEAFPGFSEELFKWEANMLWSLKQYEHLDKPLNVWDILTALSAFKQSAPKYVERILVKWLSISYVGYHLGPCSEEILSRASRNLQNISSRQLHLLNILCRRVVLLELKADKINIKHQNLGGIYDAEQEPPNLWMELLLSSENEIRKRLVGFSFSVVLNRLSCSATNISKHGYWHPAGLAQMEQWIALDHDHVQDPLKLLTLEVGELDRSTLYSICDYVAEEQCSYCSASVPFESPEVAFCQGLTCNDGVGQSRHKLVRCAVSMRVCPTTPSWFCVCCQRWASKLAPHTLFQMPKYPPDFKSSTEFSTLYMLPKPLCPFCGILQQRLQPGFLLSPSPV